MSIGEILVLDGIRLCERPSRIIPSKGLSKCPFRNRWEASKETICKLIHIVIVCAIVLHQLVVATCMNDFPTHVTLEHGQSSENT